MSQETMQYLNSGNIMIGNRELREAWWYDEAMENPEAPSHYDGFLPLQEVQSRLFDWTAERADVYVMMQDGLVQDENRVAIYRSDTKEILGHHGAGWEAHQLKDTFIAETRNILGGAELGITSAGLLKKGAVGWMEISIPEMLHNDDCGFSYRPNLLVSTSFDGSLATSWTRTITATVCDNTLKWALHEAGNTGKYKSKHTKTSVHRFGNAVAALGLVENTISDFDAALISMMETKVSDMKFIEWLDVIVPVPDIKEGQNTNSVTFAVNKREKLQNMWHSDPRVAPWHGTKLGVMQAFNTFQTHESIVRGGDNPVASRVERNMLKNLSDVAMREDRDAMKALDLILA